MNFDDRVAFPLPCLYCGQPTQWVEAQKALVCFACVQCFDAVPVNSLFLDDGECEFELHDRECLIYKENLSESQ
jgi:hypothetical protein